MDVKRVAVAGVVVEGWRKLEVRDVREIELRSTFHLTAVAIQHGNTGEPDEFPDPDQPLTLQDQLVLVGRPVDLQRFVADLDEPQPPPHSQAAEPFVGTGELSK